jgi:hypothetical protein
MISWRNNEKRISEKRCNNENGERNESENNESIECRRQLKKVKRISGEMAWRK